MSTTKSTSVTLVFLLCLGAGCSDNRIKQSRAPLQQKEMLSSAIGNRTPILEAPNYDLRNAHLARMTNRELSQRVELLERRLNKSKERAYGGQLFGVAQLSERIERVKRILAQADLEQSDWAEPQLVRKALEVQLELDRFQELAKH